MAPQANEEVDIIELRRDILEALETLAPEHPRATADMLQKFLEMRNGHLHSVGKLGNNLRVLKKRGVLAEVRVRGHRYWSLTGKEYKEEGTQMVLVAFPKKMHDQIKAFVKLGDGRKRKLSKTAFILNMVGIGLRSLDSLQKELDFQDRENEDPVKKAYTREALAEEVFAQQSE